MLFIRKRELSDSRLDRLLLRLRQDILTVRKEGPSHDMRGLWVTGLDVVSRSRLYFCRVFVSW